MCNFVIKLFFFLKLLRYHVLNCLFHLSYVLLVQLYWVLEEEEHYSHDVLEMFLEIAKTYLAQDQRVVQMSLPPAEELQSSPVVVTRALVLSLKIVR